MYTAKSLQAKDFFRVVAGNHDHHGNVSAQISYSNVSARWRFDDYYYTMHEAAPDGSTVDVVYIDTVLLAGNSDTADGRELKGSELPGPYSAPSAGAISVSPEPNNGFSQLQLLHYVSHRHHLDLSQPLCRSDHSEP